MPKHLIVFTGILLSVSFLSGKAQNTELSDAIHKDTVFVDGQQLNEKQLKRYYRQYEKIPSERIKKYGGQSSEDRLIHLKHLWAWEELYWPVSE